MANTFRNYSAAILASNTDVVPAASGTNTNGDARAASSTCVVHALYISNIDGVSSVDVDLLVGDGSPDFYVLKNVPVPANSTLVLDKPINLETTHSLKAVTAATSDLEIVAAVLEITA